MMLIAGILLTLIGVGLIWQAWRLGRDGRERARLVSRWAGWGLLTLSIWPWQLAAGADRGVALTLTVAMLAGLTVVGALGWRHIQEQKLKPRKRRRTPNTADPIPQSRGELLSRMWIFLLAGPLAGIAALALAVVVNSLGADWSGANRVAAGLIVMPLAWSVLTTVATYDLSIRRRSIIVLSVLVAAVTGAFLLPGGPI